MTSAQLRSHVGKRPRGAQPPAARPARNRIAILALAIGAAFATQHAGAQTAGAEWTTPGGDQGGMRYSTLDQITPANASTLVEEFAMPTGTRHSHQGQPLVVGQTMYVVTPYPNKLIAIDLRSRQKLWEFKPKVDEYARGVSCCDVVNRGAAYVNGKVIYATLDDTVVAVDAQRGRQLWRTRLGRPQTGETITAAPIIVKDKVIIGNAGGELGIRGWVQALNVNTGAVVWKGFNTGPDSEVKITANTKPFYAKDRGTDLGAKSWPGTLYKQGGATAWGWFTYDAGTNLVYYGTAQPGVWNPDMRPGDNKWGSAIIARDADTGEVKWAYQVNPHDSWDFDAMSESIVADINVGGSLRKTVTHFNKNGFAYTMDRTTGQVLKANKFVAQVTWADHVDLGTGLAAVNAGMQPHEGQTTSNVCPSPLGGKEFVPAAFSPKTNLFYVPTINFCMDFEPLRAIFIQSTPFTGANIALKPGAGGYGGEFVAYNPSTGARAWTIKEPLPLYSGVLATAGNVVFYGTLEGNFKAVDATSGKVLFQKKLECGITGNPIAFMGPDNKQRVAVYTGTGTLNGGFAGGACPKISDDDDGGSRNTTGPSSGAVHVFKLP